MARRRKNDDHGLSLDSLMDALTNVVAVLILVLLLVQADVVQKVDEFLDNLKPATPEEIEASSQRLADIKKQFEKKQQLLTRKVPTKEEIETERRELDLLEEKMIDNRQLLAERSQLQELEKKLRLDRDQKQKRTDGLLAEIARLEALLAKTPEKEAKPDVVTIPASRPIPENAKIYYALVVDGRAHLIDPFTPLKVFDEVFREEKRYWLVERIKRQGADRYVYDGHKIHEHFKKVDFKNRRGQKVDVDAPPTANRVWINIRPNLKKGGTTTEELRQPGSNFESALKALSRVRGAVLVFQVNPNSFDAYLAARQLADKANLPAGWEVSENRHHWFAVPDLETKRRQQPKSAPNKPDDKPKPPKIGPKLD